MNNSLIVYFTGEPILQPFLKKHYENKMNGVDMCDQNVGYYGLRRKSVKWYKKLAFYFFRLCRVQAYVLYKV